MTRKGKLVSDGFDERDADARRPATSSTKYSRSQGLSTYRQRRRRDRVFRVVVVIVVLAIVAGGVALFGRQLVGGKLPSFSLPSMSAPAQTKAEGKQEEVVLVEPAQISLAFAGDVVMNSAVVDSGSDYSGKYNFSHLFTHLTPEINSYDVRGLSQETNMAGNSFGYGNSVPLNAPTELGTAEVNAGFNVVLHATNHAADMGREGIHNELLWWHGNNSSIPVVGVAEPDLAGNPSLSDYVNNVYIYEKAGFKVAILNHSTEIADEDRDVVSTLDEEKIAADVAKARELGAEMIVACPHWGNEGDSEVVEEETQFAQIYANHGVDVVVGTHPRVLQRAEILTGPEGHQTVCYYSLGCLVSSIGTENLLGGIAELTLTRDAQRTYHIAGAKLKPIVTNRASGTDFASYMLADYSDDISGSSWDGQSREALNERCSEILGAGYNAETYELTII